jgi:hypothetical protein
VVVIALLLGFLLSSGLLLVLLVEDFALQAALRHQRLQGSGYGRPLRCFGEPSVDWVEWGYYYVMFKLFNSYIRQNLPSASIHITSSTQQTSTEHHKQQAQTILLLQGGTTWGYD